MKKVQEKENKLKALPDKELKKLSQNWSPEEWENYLKENVEVPLKETQISSKQYQKLSEKMTGTMFENVSYSQGEAKRSFKDKIRPTMKLLSPKEREVIRYLFWHNKTREETAEALGIGLGNVHNLRKRALEKMKVYFVENPQKVPKKVQVLKKNEKFFSSLFSYSCKRPVA